ncbi:hypothetical protein [Sulfurimonas sp.]|uniref:hypothetical protein n=1 Tax=Sulfurimonas sp. TaxID=2022749 RepID=UPI002634FFBD|nr:hypothetical protein [Sulfurimonas sp.]
MSINRQKISIEYRYRGSIEFPDTTEAKDIFFRVKQAYANHEKMSIALLFTKSKLLKLRNYQKGASQKELLNLDFYIELGEILGFNTNDAQKLKRAILLINDTAYSSFNITKRLKLINKKHKSKTDKNYLFWDIENFSNIASIFNDIIEPYEIDDAHIYLAANPDSLYLKKAEWEANLYDYSKTLHSFNFTKCEHGKNVADDILLQTFEELALKNANVFLLTYDRELKERFTQATAKSNNLFILGK